MNSDEIKYYECHINLEPAEGNREELEAIASVGNFRLAKFTMFKGTEADSFMTGRGQNREDLYSKALQIKDTLISKGYIPHRLKIEAVILDERF
jgi:hypothetical protein